MFEDLEKQDAEMKRMGVLKMDEYERVKEELVLAEVRKKEMEEAMARGAVLRER